MSIWKRFLLAAVLAALHLVVLSATSFLQSIACLFWPALAVRTLALVLAAPALGLQGLVDLNLAFVIPSWACFWLWHLFTPMLVVRLRSLVRVIKAPTVRSRRMLFVGTGVALVGATGVARETNDLKIRHRSLELPGLPRQLSGLKIALLADIHRGPAVSQHFLEELVDRVNTLKPDIILMPGDFISKSPVYYADLENALSRLKPSIASFATLGNHDAWEGAEAALDMLQNAGVRTLQNHAVFLTSDRRLSERPTNGLCLAGVEDLWTGKPDLEKALGVVPKSVPTILLSHNPDLAEWEQGKDYRVDLQVSGHTHGGQIVLPGLGPFATASAHGTKYLAGLNQGPHWPVFTTTGVGTSSIPVRVGASPEIVMFKACG